MKKILLLITLLAISTTASVDVPPAHEFTVINGKCEAISVRYRGAGIPEGHSFLFFVDDYLVLEYVSDGSRPPKGWIIPADPGEHHLVIKWDYTPDMGGMAGQAIVYDDYVTVDACSTWQLRGVLPVEHRAIKAGKYSW